MKFYGSDPNGKNSRESIPIGDHRFRSFSRQEIADRNDNLDVIWLEPEHQTTGYANETFEAISGDLIDISRVLLSQSQVLQKLVGSGLNGPSDSEVDPHQPFVGGDIVTIGDISKDLFDGPFGSKLKSSDYAISGKQVVRLENIGSMTY